MRQLSDEKKIVIENTRGLMRRVFSLSPSVEHALEQFASVSEENRLTVEKCERLIKGQGYVRTKSRVYKLADLKDGKALVWKGYELACIKEKSIVKRSDTVGSFCDKFIGVGEDGTPHIFAYECDLLDMIRNTERKLGAKVTGYGAIWVTGPNGEPILRSVAKMNDEGDLELL